MRVFKKLAAVGSACLVLGLAAGPAQAEIGQLADPSNPQTLTAAPLPTWQTNGTVWDIATVNGVVYVGGNFTSVRPPGAAAGTGEVTRNRLAAFNAATGELLSWAPSAKSTPFTPAGTPDVNCTPVANGQIECATVWSITPTPDKKSIVIGGDFQTINEGAGAKVRPGLAAFTAPSNGSLGLTTPGTLNTVFKPSVSGRVYSVAATNSAVYVGGGVTKVAGTTVTGVAALDFPGTTAAAAGTFKSGFTPPAVVKGSGNGNTGVRKVVLTADGSRLIVGGGYNSLAGRAIHGLQAVDAATGAPATWNSNRITNSAYVTNLKIVDGVIYTNGDANGSTSEGIIALDAATGTELWYDGCRGASHSMAVVKGIVYVGSHSHDCGAMQGGFGEQYNGYSTADNRRYTLRAEMPTADGSVKLLPWTPKTDDMNGARAMQFFEGTDANGANANLWVGGEFKMVDYGSQQGLTRFGFLGAAGTDRKPLKPNAPTLTSSRPGVVDIAFQAAEDPDNRTLTYDIIRDENTSKPIYTTTTSAAPWLLGWMHFQDTVADGSTHTYYVRVTDPLNSRNSSGQSTITAATASAPLSQLAKTDGAAMQFSFESRVSGSYVDGVGGKTATPQNGATTAAGNGVSGNAMALSGSSSILSRGVAVVGTREWTTRQFSVETMFKTNTTRGGSLLSFGSSNSSSSATGSPTGQLYMDNSGRLNFGLQPNADRTGQWWGTPAIQRRALTSAGTYRDNAWHHVVATFQPSGTRIYIDGILAAEDTTMTWTMPVNAYVRMGADSLSGFPNSPSSAWWAGTLDEVATYKYPLSAKQVQAHSNAVFQALSVPAGLAGTATGETSVDLTWRTTDFATGYKVYRDGVLVGSPTTDSFADTGLTASTTYKYRVAATNAAGEGPATDEISVKTSDPAPPPDTTVPSAPGTPTVTVNGTAVALAWGAASDDVGVDQYRIYRGTTSDFTVSSDTLRGTVAGTTPAWQEPAVPVGSWYYRVVAVDAAGNAGAASDSAPAVVQPLGPQTLRVTASADTWVNSAAPTATAGSSWVMRAKGTSGAQVPYMRFVLPAAPAGQTLTAARLELTTSANSWAGSPGSYELRLVDDNSWVESMTWDSRPAVSATVLGTFPAGTAPNQSLSIPLSLAGLPGPGAGLSVALTGASADNLELFTRENPSGRPTLVLTYS